MQKKKQKKMKDSFKNRVLNVVSSIPKGSVLTYSDVAHAAGSPRAARAVGTILKKNADPHIPCHRVIKSNGMLGSYNGLRGDKASLLKAEGYAVTN